jgi:hypothetical protein
MAKNREQTYGLTKADIKVVRDIKRRVLGGGGSRRPPGIRRRNRGGPEDQTGLAFALIDALDLTASTHTPGVGPVDIPGGPGSLGVNARNLTGHPIWQGSRVTLSMVDGQISIVESDSATLIVGEYVSGPVGEAASYTWAGSGAPHNAVYFNPSEIDDVGRFIVEDPLALGTTGKMWFATGGSGPGVGDGLGPTQANYLQKVSRVGASAEGDFPGWPGPDPGTGTESVTILKAIVNEALDVGSADATFAFDGATVYGSVGTAPGGGTGTCTNCGQAFTNNETLLVVGDGTTWGAVKLTTNWIKAKVNVSGGVGAGTSPFTFDTITALVGTATAIASPSAINLPGVEWLDDEDLILYQRDDGDWQPLKGNFNYFIRVQGDATAAVAATDATFTIDNVSVIEGDLPKLTSSTLTIQNVGKVSLANNQVVEVRWNDNTDAWETEVPRYHVIKGTSPGVTRASTTFTLGSPVAVQGELPVGTITVSCDPKIHAPASSVVYARYDITKHGTDNLQRWSTADAGNDEWIKKGYPDFDATKKMLLTSDANTLEWNEIAAVLKWLGGHTAGTDQAVQHLASTDPAWEDTTTACP